MNSYLHKIIQKHKEEERPHVGLITNMLRDWLYHNNDEERKGEEIRSKNKERSRMSEERILSFCSQLLIAGYMTTTNLIGNIFLSLLENPQEFKRLQENLSLIHRLLRRLYVIDHLFNRYSGSQLMIIST